MNLQHYTDHLAQFARERDWEQFHTPKNLAMAVAGEAGELVERFQWLTPEQSENLSEADLAAVTEEVADVFIFLIRLADVMDIDMEEAVKAKLAKNAEKYPIDRALGLA
jgi:dCTP diphosphatase